MNRFNNESITRMLMFVQKSVAESSAESAGFIVAYLIFTGVLFGVLSLTNRLPTSWSLIHVAAITCAITFIGAGLKKVIT